MLNAGTYFKLTNLQVLCKPEHQAEIQCIVACKISIKQFSLFKMSEVWTKWTNFVKLICEIVRAVLIIKP